MLPTIFATLLSVEHAHVRLDGLRTDDSLVGTLRLIQIRVIFTVWTILYIDGHTQNLATCALVGHNWRRCIDEKRECGYPSHLTTH